MQRFTKIQKTDSKKPGDIANMYTGKDMNIISYKEWDIIKGKDKLVILPFFKDDGHILLTYENIPTFQYRYKNVEGYKNVTNFLTTIKGDIKEGEDLTVAVRRILSEKTGVILNSTYPITIDKNLFKDEKNTGRYVISLLEINYNDYQQGHVNQMDGQNNVVKISLGDLDNLKTFDLITDYMILKLKYENKL